MPDLKILINPQPEHCTPETGIGRVALAQYKYLQFFGFRFTSDPQDADIIACHVNRPQNLPRVDALHLHGLNWSDTPHWPYSSSFHSVNRMVVQSIKEARTVTVPSNWVANPLRRDMRLNPFVIGHGLELNEWKPDRNLGYILWNKNRNMDVCDPTPAYELAMRGETVFSTFAPKGKEAILPPTLHLTGLLSAPKMKTLISCADVYLASTMETFGIGTLEALACGVPVLGYNWGGTADIIHHGVNGYLVEPGNIAGLVDGLAWVREHRKELSQNARELAQEYSWEKIIGKYAILYERLGKLEPKGVAVVVPCYNYGQYLEACITSLLNQTRRPDEIIIVDDASTDDSRQVAEALMETAPELIRVIHQEPNQGVAAARNIGIESAWSPLVVCLDADDCLAPDYISLVAGEMERDPSLGIAYTGLAMLHEDGRETRSEWPPEFDWKIMTTVSVPPSNCIPSAAMFRREMWRRSGGYKQVYAPAEDTEFWVRGLSVGFNCRKVSAAPLFIYRPHSGSASRRLEYKAINIWHPWMNDKQYPMGAPDQKKPMVRSYALPEVSVIIPVGPGHLKYLPSALDSLLGQTFRNWEVIVIDDSGEDIKYDLLLDPYPFPKYLETIVPGSGAGAARNLGLKAARAPLVLFLDADDYIAPKAMEKMLWLFSESEGRYIYTDWVSVEESGKKEQHQLDEYHARTWLERLVDGTGGLNAVTVLMATADAKTIEFDEQLQLLEDSDFFARCAIAGIWGKRLAEPLLYYRLFSGSRRAAPIKERAVINRQFKEWYQAYLEGDKEMAESCCGGTAASAILAAKRAVAGIPPSSAEEPTAPGPSVTTTESATVRMEFIGEARGPVSYWGNDGRFYRGANSPTNRFANVHPADVGKLEATGMWKRLGGFEERVELLEAPAAISEAERRKAAEDALLKAREEFAAANPEPDDSGFSEPKDEDEPPTEPFWTPEPALEPEILEELETPIKDTPKVPARIKLEKKGKKNG